MPRCGLLLPACLALLFSACRADSGASPATTPAPSQAQSADAESTVDGAILRVTAVPSSQLPDAVAREYGIARSPRTILLLVNLRELGSGPTPAVSATVTDLQQQAAPVALRAVRVAQSDTVDYIGTVDATPPDTLRFTVVARRNGAAATVAISRDIYPQ